MLPLLAVHQDIVRVPEEGPLLHLQQAKEGPARLATAIGDQDVQGPLALQHHKARRPREGGEPAVLGRGCLDPRQINDSLLKDNRPYVLK